MTSHSVVRPLLGEPRSIVIEAKQNSLERMTGSRRITTLITADDSPMDRLIRLCWLFSTNIDGGILKNEQSVKQKRNDDTDRQLSNNSKASSIIWSANSSAQSGESDILGNL